MSFETKKEGSNSQIDQEEKAPTIGLNGTVIATIGLRFTLKLSNPRDHKEEVASDVNDNKDAQSVSKMEEDENEEVSSDVVNSISEGGELKNSKVTDNEVLEESGSFEGENSDSDHIPSSQTPTCPECLKTFPSYKSLYGHLRSHPNRGYRGVNRPANGLKRRDLNVSGWGVRAKRRGSFVEEAIFAAAETLISMSQSKPGPVKVEEKCQLQTRKCSYAAKTYHCSICDKSFTTHQALGGHRASHNKNRNNSDAEALEGAAENCAGHAREGTEHKCKTCNETFATGQALGGHMRRHYNSPPSTVSSEENVRIENHAQESVGSENRSSIGFDLNEDPPQSEEE